MNPAFREVLMASDQDRRDLFLATSRRFGTTEQNVEKDFWVCWTLDALFNGLPPTDPRLLFKGGTSLSKGFGLISRFSEDIDVTVFRDDIGQAVSVEDLEGLSGKRRQARLDEIKDACQAYITGPLHSELIRIADSESKATGGRLENIRIYTDADDPDQQTLLVAYPTVTTADAYVRPIVRIESGAKSALDPHQAAIIKPYISDDLPKLDLSVSGVTTINPERTFWDKVVIIHGLRRWFDQRGVLRQAGQRVSRHYYDLHCLLRSPSGAAASEDRNMGVDCARHAKMFFNRRDYDLDSAMPGSFALTPATAMMDPLRRDYTAMAGMIFGDIPPFDDVLTSIAELQERLNKPKAAL